MEYIVSELESNLIKKNNTLFTNIDGENIIENENSIIKFLGIVQAGYRSKLALGLAKGEEQIIYNYVDCLEDLKEQIKNVGKSMSIYNKEKEK